MPFINITIIFLKNPGSTSLVSFFYNQNISN